MTLSDEIDATLMELAALARDLRVDPRSRDLSTLAGALSMTLMQALAGLAQAERVVARATEMSRVGGAAWTEMLEGVATGNPSRAERLARCEASYAEARALEGHAELRLTEARRRAISTHASVLLWMESLRAKLAHRLAARPRDAAA